jgi:predicted RNase H-like HicB family nuclease
MFYTLAAYRAARMSKRTIINVKANITWKSCRDPESGHWLAECAPLGLVITAKTHTELAENAGEALDMLLNELLSSGDLEKFLREHGWSITQNIPQHVPVRFDVPFQLKSKPRHDSEGVLC